MGEDCTHLYVVLTTLNFRCGTKPDKPRFNGAHNNKTSWMGDDCPYMLCSPPSISNVELNLISLMQSRTIISSSHGLVTGMQTSTNPRPQRFAVQGSTSTRWSVLAPFPAKRVGFPFLSIHRLRRVDFRPLIGRVVGRMSFWQSAYNIAGRNALVKEVLSS